MGERKTDSGTGAMTVVISSVLVTRAKVIWNGIGFQGSDASIAEAPIDTSNFPDSGAGGCLGVGSSGRSISSLAA